MESELKAILIAICNEFCRATGRKSTGVWASAVGDARFQERIEGGRTFTVKVFDSALYWFSSNWPEGAEWPVMVKRPIDQATEAVTSVAAE